MSLDVTALRIAELEARIAELEAFFADEQRQLKEMRRVAAELWNRLQLLHDYMKAPKHLECATCVLLRKYKYLAEVDAENVSVETGLEERVKRLEYKVQSLYEREPWKR